MRCEFPRHTFLPFYLIRWSKSYRFSSEADTFVSSSHAFLTSRVTILLCRYPSSSRSSLITPAASIKMVALSDLRGPVLFGSSCAPSLVKQSFGAYPRSFSRRDFLCFAN